jgi:hypothetical protein
MGAIWRQADVSYLHLTVEEKTHVFYGKPRIHHWTVVFGVYSNKKKGKDLNLLNEDSRGSFIMISLGRRSCESRFGKGYRE